MEQDGGTVGPHHLTEMAYPTPVTAGSAMSWSSSSGTESEEMTSALLSLKHAGPRRRIKTRWSMRHLRPQLLAPRRPRDTPSVSAWPFSPAAATALAGSLFQHVSSGLLRDLASAVSAVSAVSGSPPTRKSLPALRQALQTEFPYGHAMNAAGGAGGRRLFAAPIWDTIHAAVAVYCGTGPGDLQKRNEVALAAWTSVLACCGRGSVRGETRMQLLAVAAVLLQAKLLEEADVDVARLLRRLHWEGRVREGAVKRAERQMAQLLEWRLLWPSPQVLLALLLDNLGQWLAVPPTLRLLASQVLDQLLARDFVRRVLAARIAHLGRLGPIVLGVLFEVLADFFAGVDGDGLTRDRIWQVLLCTLDESCRAHMLPDAASDGVVADAIFPEWVRMEILTALDHLATARPVTYKL